MENNNPNSLWSDFWSESLKKENQSSIFIKEPPTVKDFTHNWIHSPLFPKQENLLDLGFTKDYKNLSTEYNEFVIAWGKRCVSGDTKLVDEKTKKEYTIQELAENNKSIQIKSVFIDSFGNRTKIVVPTGIPFLKGKSKLFKITLESGETIIVGEHHRFLTKAGWKELKNITVNEKILADSKKSISPEVELLRREKISKTMKQNPPKHLFNKPKKIIEKITQGVNRFYKSLTKEQINNTYNTWKDLTEKERQEKINHLSEVCSGKYGKFPSKNTYSKEKRFLSCRFWKRLRKLIIESYDFTCQVCKIRVENYSYFDVHHIDNNRFNNNPANLLCLCHKCHSSLPKTREDKSVNI
jgi:hypothetical protein